MMRAILEYLLSVTRGNADITVARLSFDLERYLKVSRLHYNRCPLQYYDVDVIELEAP